VEAGAELECTIARAWQVLTDYDRLARFIPNLQVSRIVSRQGDDIVVE
jgi:carbon monoxide dehydrogenase subunit G